MLKEKVGISKVFIACGYTDTRKVMENMRRHDPHSPFLLGNSEESDVVHKAEQFIWKERQLRLF